MKTLLSTGSLPKNLQQLRLDWIEAVTKNSIQVSSAGDRRPIVEPSLLPLMVHVNRKRK